MEKVYNSTKSDWAEILKRPTQTLADIEATVTEIFTEVKSKGDMAVKKYTNLFDGIQLDNTKVTNAEIDEANTAISEELKECN